VRFYVGEENNQFKGFLKIRSPKTETNSKFEEFKPHGLAGSYAAEANG